jgi:hypothetical protein
MPNPMPMQPVQQSYDPRWFIWTIVFLLVTGISLVSYIMLSDTSSADQGGVIVHRTSTPKTVRE